MMPSDEKRSVLAGPHGMMTINDGAGPKVLDISRCGAALWGLGQRLARLSGAKKPCLRAADQTADILRMWRTVERSFERLNNADKERVRAENHGCAPRFSGFGSSGGRHYGISEHMIDGVGRWQEGLALGEPPLF